MSVPGVALKTMMSIYALNISILSCSGHMKQALSNCLPLEEKHRIEATNQILSYVGYGQRLPFLSWCLLFLFLKALCHDKRLVAFQ